MCPSMTSEVMLHVITKFGFHKVSINIQSHQNQFINECFEIKLLKSMKYARIFFRETENNLHS